MSAAIAKAMTFGEQERQVRGIERHLLSIDRRLLQIQTAIRQVSTLAAAGDHSATNAVAYNRLAESVAQRALDLLAENAKSFAEINSTIARLAGPQD